MSGLPSWAVPGAKCVFIGTSRAVSPGVPMPLAGKVYTVRIAAISPRGIPIIALAELPARRRNGGECGYRVESFRPVATRSLDDDMATHFDHHLHLHDFHPEPV